MIFSDRNIRAVDHAEVIERDLNRAAGDGIGADFARGNICVHKLDFVVVAVFTLRHALDGVLADVRSARRRRREREDGICGVVQITRDGIEIGLYIRTSFDFERDGLLAVDGSLRVDGNSDLGLRNAESLRYAVFAILIAELIVPLLGVG